MADIIIAAASTEPRLRDPDVSAARRRRELAAFGLPPLLFRGRRVTQIQGSAADLLQCSLWGADAALFEPRPARAEVAELLFRQHRCNLRLRADGGEPDGAALDRAEILLCEEDLLSGADPLGRLARRLAGLRSSAVAVVALMDADATLPWRLRRAAVAAAASSLAERERQAQRWFGAALAAAAAARGESVAAACARLFLGPEPAVVDRAAVAQVIAAAGCEWLVAGPAPAPAWVELAAKIRARDFDDRDVAPLAEPPYGHERWAFSVLKP